MVRSSPARGRFLGILWPHLETLSASWATWALFMPGTSEDNPAVQVITTSAALVSYFQVLFLDFLKVLQ